MDTTTVAHPRTPDTREERALELYRTRGHEIRRVGDELYLVPSCTGRGFYAVRYGGEVESCDCPDHAYHPEVSCKHLLAAGIHHAKRRGESRPCACLGGLVYIGHLVEEVEVIEAVPYRRCG